VPSLISRFQPPSASSRLPDSSASRSVAFQIRHPVFRAVQTSISTPASEHPPLLLQVSPLRSDPACSGSSKFQDKQCFWKFNPSISRFLHRASHPLAFAPPGFMPTATPRFSVLRSFECRIRWMNPVHFALHVLLFTSTRQLSYFASQNWPGVGFEFTFLVLVDCTSDHHAILVLLDRSPVPCSITFFICRACTEILIQPLVLHIRRRGAHQSCRIAKIIRCGIWTHTLGVGGLHFEPPRYLGVFGLISSSMFGHFLFL